MYMASFDVRDLYDYGSPLENYKNLDGQIDIG